MSYKIFRPDRNICSYHQDIIDFAKKIQNFREKDYETVADLLSDVEYLASKIEELGEYALVAGQKMEDRLVEYKHGIESLGFKRIKL
jgi:hypothetical protein